MRCDYVPSWPFSLNLNLRNDHNANKSSNISTGAAGIAGPHHLLVAGMLLNLSRQVKCTLHWDMLGVAGSF